jgi:hypothetical protein
MIRKLENKDILKGREKAAPLTPDMEDNLLELLSALNELQNIWPEQFIVTSGYRPAAINQQVGGSKKSAHLMCQAADILDTDQYLSHFLLRNPQYLEANGLYMEHPDYTKTWCHLQIRPTRNRIFKPY